jgi:acyl-CoA thioesterase-1
MNSLTRRVRLCAPLLMAVAGACGSSASPAGPSEAPAASARPRQVVVLGDSLAVSPSRAESFPAVLQARLSGLATPWIVVNAGVGGDTTAGGLRRVAALLGEEVAILVVALGANDGLRGVPAETIEQNLAGIIERAQTRHVGVLLCGMETPPLRGWQYTVAFHKLFPRLADRYDVPLVPFLLAGVILDPDMNGTDGIHPNAGGARRIADTIWPYLEPMVRGASRDTAQTRSRSSATGASDS